MTDAQRLETCSSRPFQSWCILPVRDDNSDRGVNVSTLNGIDDGLQISAAPRDENSDFCKGVGTHYIPLMRSGLTTHDAWVSRQSQLTPQAGTRLAPQSAHAATQTNRDTRGHLSRHQPWVPKGQIIRDGRRLPRLRTAAAQDDRAIRRRSSCVLPDAEPLASRRLAGCRSNPVARDALADHHARPTLAPSSWHLRARGSLSRSIQGYPHPGRSTLAVGVSVCGAKRLPCVAHRPGRGVAVVQPVAARTSHGPDMAQTMAGASTC